jgi:hypothetical protein
MADAREPVEQAWNEDRHARAEARFEAGSVTVFHVIGSGDRGSASNLRLAYQVRPAETPSRFQKKFEIPELAATEMIVGSRRTGQKPLNGAVDFMP